MTAKEQHKAAERALHEAAGRTGDFDGVWKLLESAREAATAEQDRDTEAAILYELGMVRHYRSLDRRAHGQDILESDIDDEETFFQRALALRRELDDDAGAARPLFGLGLVRQLLRRDWAAAMPYFWQALDRVEELEARGDLYACSEFHRHVGFFYLVENGQPRQGLRHLRRSLELRERMGEPLVVPAGLAALGEAESAAGEYEAAVRTLTRTVALVKELQFNPLHIARTEKALAEAEAGAARERGTL